MTTLIASQMPLPDGIRGASVEEHSDIKKVVVTKTN